MTGIYIDYDPLMVVTLFLSNSATSLIMSPEDRFVKKSMKF